MMYSFIIPVYNCKKFLADCVQSIRAIGELSYEILLIDDGSTDGSGGLCDDLAQQYSEIRVFHQKNAGASAARNRGIREAKGDRILFFDADDTVDAFALEQLLLDDRCLQTDLTIYGLTFDYYYHGKCYRQDPLFFVYDGILTKDQFAASFSELYEANSLSPLWNKVFSREILVQNGLFLNTDMFLYEDFEFVLRYLQHCETVYNVPKAVYHYRQTEDERNFLRRLLRIDSLSIFLEPIEGSLFGLVKSNSAVSKEFATDILHSLYLTMARVKTSGLDLAGIHRICRDYQTWVHAHGLPPSADTFSQHLLGNKALLIYLTHKKTALRHWLAVRVKAFLHHSGGHHE